MDDASSRRAELEARIQSLCQAEDFAASTTAAIEGYGPELLGYLHAIAPTEVDAVEAFSSFCEDLWKGLPDFRWASSFRTWAYTLARHAFHRQMRDPHRARQVPLSRVPEVEQVAERIRTTTVQWLRTEVKDRVRELRQKLDPDDQSLFILRLDRQLAWTDIAQIMSDETEPSADELRKQAATLRKRFERAKDRLRELVQGSS